MFQENYGLWTVIGEPQRSGQKRRTYIRCRCACGKEADVDAYTLKKGTSSGCRRCKAVTAMNTANRTHGLSGGKHPLYGVWKELRRRCTSPNHPRYPDYGGRGITVCDEWNNSFEAFFDWSLNNGYGPKMTLDRNDNEKGYGPDNCRFVSNKVNCWNKRDNRLVSAFGETKPLAEWVADPRCSVPYSCLFARLENGHEPETAIVTPSGKL